MADILLIMAKNIQWVSMDYENTEFEEVAAGEDFVTYRLSSNETTKKEYPFDFKLEITHRLQGGRLSVEWKVTNTGDKEMYFTIGGHHHLT